MGSGVRRARRRDAAFKALLWTAAAITGGVLLLVVGSTVSRGLVSDNMVESDFVATGSTLIPLDGGGSATVIVNDRVRVVDLTAEDVKKLLDGDEGDWGDLTGQNLPVAVFISGGSLPMEAVQRTLLPSGRWAVGAVSLSSERDVAERVAITEGGIGVVRAGSPSAILPGVKEVPVRMLSVCVNPSVTALKDAKRLSFVTQEQLDAILRGGVNNWRDVGGQDEPVRFLAADAASSDAARIAAVVRTPGAIALCPWRVAASAPQLILPVQRREVRRNLTLGYLFEEPRRAGKVGGVSTIILNTLVMILLTLLFTTPIGVAAGVYLTEYTRQGGAVEVLRFGTETLAGVPSIIFGLFGFIVFVTKLRLGIGLLSGTLTVTIMVLPTIIRTTEEALRAVPDSLRAGSLALGATKWQTTVRVTLPAASPGILMGVILAVGRVMGETAALLFTMGTDYRLVQGFGSSARVLAVHLYFLLKEGISFDRAFAAATILIVIVLAVNFLTTRLVGGMSRTHEPGRRIRASAAGRGRGTAA